MPYNTRRKSISLSSLGIHVPVSHSRKSTSTPTPAATLPALRIRRAAPSDSEDEPEYKRIKTSRYHSAVTYGQASPLSPGFGKFFRSLRTTATSAPWCDIDDDVVRATIEQLYLTGNRPLFIKELADLLSSKLPVIQHSANPTVIVASRLSAFIKRSSWTLKSPCPVGKELELVHPRRTYFFLTTCPRHPLQPQSTSSCSHSNVCLHSLSPRDSSDASAASDESEQYDSDGDLSDNNSVYRERSLSPEVDLSAPELDSSDDIDDVDIDTQSPTWLKYRRGRGPPPPLELDEHEFTQTATGLQKRNPDVSYLAPSFSETSESESELAFIDDLPKYDLWANESRVSGVINSMPSSYAFNLKENSSPQKKDSESDYWLALGPSVASWDRISETIDLDELDTLLENC